MRNVWLRIMLCLGLISTIGIGAASGKAWLLSLYCLEWDAAVLEESAEYLGNPDCGWYEIYGYELGENVSLTKTLDDHRNACDPSIRLVQIQINLRQYRQQDISQRGLDELEEVLCAWEQTNRRMILRFLYDWSGHGQESEPDDIRQITSHMQQVATVVNAHKNSIYTLQGVFVGDVGEMHGTKYMNVESFHTLVNSMAEAFDPQIYLAVRTPEQLRIALCSDGFIDAKRAYDGSLNSRMGLFNDGMMGSESDLGTYGEQSLQLASDYSGKGTRDEELDFQRNRCIYVPNGGEAVLSNPYNDCPKAYENLSCMHVSYLNRQHHAEVLDKWKQVIYDGGEEAFIGKSAYDYIGTHLGYRYVVRDASVELERPVDHEATLTMNIANVGFAPAYRKFDVQILMSSTEEPSTTVILADVDNRSWPPGDVQKIMIPLDLGQASVGTYQLYLQMTDPYTGEPIRFGNTIDETDTGYYLGRFTLEHLYGE